MKLLDKTLASPAENLALEEALLDWVEDHYQQEILRFWEPETYFVVVGYGNHVSREVNQPFCEQTGIPILRRTSGGGTVLQGPGVLNYSLILRIAGGEALAGISSTNKFVMTRQREALAQAVSRAVQVQGLSDLTVGEVKVSGNAQRRKKSFLLFHGSFLLNLDIGLAQRALARPSKEPSYRAGRSHSEFMQNLGVAPGIIKTALAKIWGAQEPSACPPPEMIQALASEKYLSRDWNFKFP